MIVVLDTIVGVLDGIYPLAFHIWSDDVIIIIEV